jgi:hypothetical protein
MRGLEDKPMNPMSAPDEVIAKLQKILAQNAEFRRKLAHGTNKTISEAQFIAGLDSLYRRLKDLDL